MSTLESDFNKRSQIDAYFTFEARPGEDLEASEKAGRAVYKDEHWVIQRPKGDNLSKTEFKVDRLRKSRPQLWEIIEPAYKAWSTGQEEPVDGIPLKGWSGCTEAQRLTLANFNIRSVEDLAGATDAIREKIPQFSKIQRVAKNYLTGIGDNSRLAEQNAALEGKLKEASELAAQQQKDIDELRGQVANLMKAGK